MTEVLEQLDQLVSERSASLQRTAETMAGENEGFLAFAVETCQHVELLSLIWRIVVRQLETGGGPAPLFAERCDLLLRLASLPAHFLGHIVNVWEARRLPAELAQPIYQKVLSAREQLTALENSLRVCRERLAFPSRVSADPAEVERRIKQTDQERKWVPLREAIGQLRGQE